mmetsp:Transcript_7865/g.18977  ORF Transcript_7865/g.18977 Transcript_7865/m.18977 type:complete len:250 (-) Transcript_7865:514-1263(-)
MEIDKEVYRQARKTTVAKKKAEKKASNGRVAPNSSLRNRNNKNVNNKTANNNNSKTKIATDQSQSIVFGRMPQKKQIAAALKGMEAAGCPIPEGHQLVMQFAPSVTPQKPAKAQKNNSNNKNNNTKSNNNNNNNNKKNNRATNNSNDPANESKTEDCTNESDAKIPDWTTKDTWTAGELLTQFKGGLMTVGNKKPKGLYSMLDLKARLPLGHTVMIANSKDEFNKKVTAGGKPVMDYLASSLVQALREP